MPAVPLYNDANYRDLLPATGSVVDFNGPRVLNAVPPADPPGQVRFAPAADFKLIPRSEWPDRIRQKDRAKTWLEDLVRGTIPCNDQGRLGYCHAYGTVMAAQCARLIQGHPYVELSAESVGGPITGWRDRGADPTDDMAQIAQYGACPASYMDAPWSLNPRRWKAGWQEAALNYRAEEWRDLRGLGPAFEVAATAAFLGLACGSGFYWWAHYVSGPYRVIDLGRGRFALRYRNNWGPDFGDDGFVDFEEGKGDPDWIFATNLMTPNDRME